MTTGEGPRWQRVGPALTDTLAKERRLRRKTIGCPSVRGTARPESQASAGPYRIGFTLPQSAEIHFPEPSIVMVSGLPCIEVRIVIFMR